MKNAGTGLVAVAVALSLFAAPAFACIGPGAGMTALSALWGVVVAIVLAVVAVIVWPLRVLFWRHRQRAVRRTRRSNRRPTSPLRRLDGAPRRPADFATS
jgi:hypothetical protein